MKRIDNIIRTIEKLEEKINCQLFKQMNKHKSDGILPSESSVGGPLITPPEQLHPNGGQGSNLPEFIYFGEFKVATKEACERSKAPNEKNVKSSDASNGRWVGNIFVSNEEIGRGKDGSVVFKGFLIEEQNQLAVKRLPLAKRSLAVKLVVDHMKLGGHSNIVNYFAVTEDSDFCYIALERCDYNLTDLIKNVYSKLSSSQLLKLKRDVASGVAMLHENNLIHGALEPQNVLINIKGSSIVAKLSDAGIRIQENKCCYDGRDATSSNWSRMMDLEQLGWIFLYMTTPVNNCVRCVSKLKDLQQVTKSENICGHCVPKLKELPELAHLLSQLLHEDPTKRPEAVQVQEHPFLWDSYHRLSFLSDMGGYIEDSATDKLLHDLEHTVHTVFLQARKNLKKNARTVFLHEKLDEDVAGKLAKDVAEWLQVDYYNYSYSTCTLLRGVRIMFDNYDELKEIFGPFPEGLDSYFSRRFPYLLIEVYNIMFKHCKSEIYLSKHFEYHLDPKLKTRVKALCWDDRCKRSGYGAQKINQRVTTVQKHY